MATIGLSRTVSEIDGDFSRKSQNIRTPLYFVPRLKGSALELGIGAVSQKTRVMVLPGRQRSLTISSAVWIECTNVTDGQTDRQTDTGRQQRPRLRIASRGKKHERWTPSPPHNARPCGSAGRVYRRLPERTCARSRGASRLICLDWLGVTPTQAGDGVWTQA